MDLALDDPEASARGAALQMLRHRPRFVRERPERVIALLSDPSPEVRGYAALALSAAPRQALSALPLLEKLMLETNKVVQASAAEALKIIRETPAE